MSFSTSAQPTTLIGLFGTGRSGSTWVGSIIDSHPEVAYRFEPFHRLHHRRAVTSWRERIERGDVENENLPNLYRLLLPAHPEVEKPPFFPKSNALNLGKRWLWPPARRIAPLALPFAKLYAPRGRPPLVFKQVSLARVFEQLAVRTSMRLVYLIRDPRGVVASLTQGQRQGVMPTGQWSVLDSLMAKHDPELARRYTPQLDRLTPIEKNTLLWRMEVERATAACREEDNTLLVSYEAMCEDPFTHARRIFEHCGLEFTEQTQRFLELSTSGSENRRNPYGDSGGGKYFSVFRNPRHSMNKWKDQLRTEEIDAILDIVRDSPAFEVFERARQGTERPAKIQRAAGE